MFNDMRKIIITLNKLQSNWVLYLFYLYLGKMLYQFCVQKSITWYWNQFSSATI